MRRRDRRSIRLGQVDPSGGVGSSQLICDYGGVDAVFGPDVLTFLQTAKQWVDPCKGLSVAGKCSGKVAQRCTSPLEGPRRLVKFNCGSLGQVPPSNLTARPAAAIPEQRLRGHASAWAVRGPFRALREPSRRFGEP